MFQEKIGLMLYLPILDHLVSSHTELIYIKDTKSRMLYVNDAYVKTYGKPREFIIGKADDTLFSPEHFLRTRPEDIEVMQTKTSTSFEGSELWPDQVIHYIRSTRRSLDISFGGKEICIGTFGVCDDLTFSKDRAIYNSVPSGIIMLQPKIIDGKPVFSITDINRAAQKIGKTTKERSFQKNIEEVFPHIGVSGISYLLDAVYQGISPDNNRMDNFQKPFRFFIGQEEKWWSGVFAQKISSDEILLVFNDETDNKIYDPLTGLKNEESFKVTVAHRLSEAEYTAIISVGIKDIDNIGKFNGLIARNELIQSIAVLLKEITSALPESEIAHGINGLFFIYPGSHQKIQSVTELTEHIADSLKARHTTLDWAQGVTLYPNDSSKIEELLQNSIIAFDNARPGTTASYDPEMFACLLEASVRKKEILQAIAKKEFYGVVQPLVSSDGKITKAEYLIRWKKAGAVISPGVFIRQAQDANLMNELGELVLNGGCHVISLWEKTGADDFALSVNVDPQQVSERLIPIISDCLARYKINPKHLILEITESGFDTGNNSDEDFERNELNSFGKIIQQIRNEYSIKIAIDDFGKENSSLSRLQYLPADVIKIDKIYTDRLVKKDPITQKISIDPFGAAIYEAIVNFAKLINADIVAEGVELQEQFDILEKLGITHYQGFLFYQPMELEKFEKLLGTSKN
jgi:EAL domain-containing protein (putative c-di-GMP-specific phosphodiesterase class I)/PAS domain-containing protein